MIIYELTCTGGHRFEGWFGSAGDFDAQRTRSLVRCPVCDDAEIAKVPFAKVHKSRGASALTERERAPEPAPAGNEQPKPMPALSGVPAEILQQLRAAVRNAENVGARFPEEARRMHYDEAPARSIRGQATPDEAASLREEGIEFASLPPFLAEDTH